MKRSRCTWALQREVQRDLNEYYLERAEAELEDHVRYYWQLTRQGPHDDCLCHEFYVMDLREAIKHLRTFRSGR